MGWGENARKAGVYWYHMTKACETSQKQVTADTSSFPFIVYSLEYSSLEFGVLSPLVFVSTFFFPLPPTPWWCLSLWCRSIGGPWWAIGFPIGPSPESFPDCPFLGGQLFLPKPQLCKTRGGVKIDLNFITKWCYFRCLVWPLQYLMLGIVM